jgi:hypothetical protein
MKEDRYRLGAMMRHWIGSLTMIQLTPAKVAQYRDERSAKSLQFLMLEKIGWHVGLFAEGSTKFRGRKPNGFENLDLNDPEQLALAILKTLPKQ